MGGLFDKTVDSTTTPVIPEWAQPFIEEALQRYSNWANQAWQLFGGGPVNQALAGGAATWNELYQALLDSGMSEEEASQQVQQLFSWQGGEGDWQGEGGEGGAGSIQIGDFWQEHARPVVGPDSLQELARKLTVYNTDLSPLYGTGLDYLTRTEGLSPQELAAQRILLESYGRASGSELPEWARAYREAGAEPIDIGDIVNTPTYDAILSSFREGVMPAISGGLAAAGLGRSAGRGAVEGAAFAPYIVDLIGKTLGTEESNRAAKMQGISGGAGILSADLDRIIRTGEGTSAGLLDLGGRLKSRLADIAQGYFGTGAAETQNRYNQIATLSQLGDVFRNISQEQAESPWYDWMRRAAAFESSIGGPMSMVPSTFGAMSSQSKKNK